MDYERRRSPSLDGVYRPSQRPPLPTPAGKPPASPVAQAPSLLNKSIPADAPLQRLDFTPPEKLRRRWTRKRKIFTSSAMVAAVCVGFGAWYVAGILGNLNRVFHGNVFSDVGAIFSNTKLKGEDQGRVNILLAGDSTDDPGHAGADLTDSIMLLSIDTRHHTGFMLSIPRDLWVDIPGRGHQKINSANDVSDFSQSGYPRGGMGQLEQIVQTDLGIPVDYYALVNYTAFRDAVDAVGGINIDLQSPDPRGVYDAYTNLKLPNGNIELNGQEALNLARARGDDSAGDVSYGLGSDFDRTEHQRQMLVALGQKAKTAGVVANPLKVTKLFDALGNNVKSDLNLQDALRLVQITRGINTSALQSVTYAYSGKDPLLADYLAPDGEEALIPRAGVDNFSQLEQFYLKLTSDNPIVKESPTVVILNASDVNGLAHKQSQLLGAKGFAVAGTADANGLYPSTMVVDNTNGQKPASRQMLSRLFPGQIVNETNAAGSAEAGEAAGYNADFVVILGQNWDPHPTTQNNLQ